MLTVLSPAKTLDFNKIETPAFSQPRLISQTEKLVKVLEQKKVPDLQKLMKVSEKIAQLNVDRFNSFSFPFSVENAKVALFAFKGDVYTGLEAEKFSQKEIQFSQKHLRILSGLYGILKPLDLMQPYRLEMGTKLPNGDFKNLYEFWGEKITDLINEDLAEAETDILLNLASKEYFKAIKPKSLKGRILNIDFKENRNGALKIIAFNAKKARGRMSHLIIKEGITNPKELKNLVVNDYIFNEENSDEKTFTFIKN